MKPQRSLLFTAPTTHFPSAVPFAVLVGWALTAQGAVIQTTFTDLPDTTPGEDLW